MVAIVTGAGGGREGGIGASIARRLAAAGATVVVNDLTQDAADATVADLEQLGLGGSAHVCDVSSSDAAATLVAETGRLLGRLDVLVNNAGILGKSTVSSMPDAEWQRVLDVNLNACFYTSRAAIGLMRRASFGRIVNVASVAGIRVSYVGSAAYTASKSGLLGLTRHLAVEVAPFGITVNAILPGVTATAMVSGERTPTAAETLGSSVPVQRAATPDDHAELVAFLAGREASYITGAAIPVDGGLSLLPGDFEAYLAKSGKGA
jgi:3-oxoacyl-[acyl-carrier protein] reductase